MRPFAVALALALFVCPPASAQQPPPRIGPFAVDIRLNFPGFPTDSAQLAQSRAIKITDLPGRGMGLEIGGQYYLFKWRGMTIGAGASFLWSSSSSDALDPPPKPTPPPTTPLPPGTPLPPIYTGLGASENFRSFAPQVSFNFGSGAGWSYISGGLGGSVWSLVPGGQQPVEADEASLKTINYGGGARWFKKKHIGFTFDVRFYAINPGIPNDGYGLSPRTTLLVIGGGVSLK